MRLNNSAPAPPETQDMVDFTRVNTFRIPTADEADIGADCYRPPGESPDREIERVVVLCHGLKGYRRWGFIPYLAERIARAGMAAVALDFSLNGRGDQQPGVDPGFEFPDRFSRNTLERENQDLRTAIEWLREVVAPEAAIGLWGHSRGGVAAILTALETPGIGALVTWSTGSNPDTYTRAQKEKWREKGVLAFRDAATGTALAIGIEYLDDVEQNADRYDLASRAGELEAPHLIVHGEHDLAVPVTHAQTLYDTELLKSDKKLLRLLTGHTFGYGGKGEGAALDSAVKATVEWFDEYLQPG